MTRTATKEFVGRGFADFTVPVPLSVWLYLPKEDEVGTNAAVILDIPRSREKRLTIGGLHTGRKEVSHQLELRVWYTNDDSQVGGRVFEVLLSKVDDVLRGFNTPQAVSDPNTGEQSTVVYVAEEIDTAVSFPEAYEEGGSNLVFMAVKTATVVEHVEG